MSEPADYSLTRLTFKNDLPELRTQSGVVGTKPAPGYTCQRPMRCGQRELVLEQNLLFFFYVKNSSAKYVFS